MSDTDDDAVLRTAMEALRRMGEGHKAGDFGPYLYQRAMMNGSTRNRGCFPAHVR